jgi:hypothetical protein
MRLQAAAVRHVEGVVYELIFYRAQGRTGSVYRYET